MPSRLSSSEKDFDGRKSCPSPSQLPIHEEQSLSSSLKYDARRKSDTLDRRKVEKSIGLDRLSADGQRLTGNMRDEMLKSALLSADQTDPGGREAKRWRLLRARGPWSCSALTISITCVGAILLLAIVQAFTSRQLDPKGCIVPWTRPTYIAFKDFDTEHTRFATKYHLYLLRDGSYDEDPKVDLRGTMNFQSLTEGQVKGVPALFIPGNAGSFKQGRILAYEALDYFHNSIQQDPAAQKDGKTSIDLFSIDFNEDFSAFHGQTVLDQAEYLNDAVAYILSLYHDPRRSQRDPSLPDPSSVILIGHSMGGIVARAMLTMPNYQSNSVNTIVTLSAPHARAPVSFDGQMVQTYKRINEYWRNAYSQRWANDNPLWHVTLISIAGGGLDVVVPSDYASLESLVPSTHGFTVFTSSIPEVWTGADHLQMAWCSQLMKPVMRAVMNALDVHRPSQTKPRAERMRIFRRGLLTGLEDVVDRSLSYQEATTLLTLDDECHDVMAEGQRLVIREFGRDTSIKARIMPIPKQQTSNSQSFTMLSDAPLDDPGSATQLDVLVCSEYPLQPGQSSALFAMNMDLSENASGSTRLACKSAASDVIKLPASTRSSLYPFDQARPFSYLHYNAADLAGHKYVAIVDKSTDAASGWVIAEFSDDEASIVETDVGLQSLLTFGMNVKLPADRALVLDIHVPALCSSLLAFTLSLGSQACGDNTELFTPLVRQYMAEPHESKFFVNVKAANVSLHGVAPFMPPPLRAQSTNAGVSVQIWSDPTCQSSIDLHLKIDILGSLGKLVMRYRVVFAAFPILIVAMVLRKQFKVYNESGMCDVPHFTVAIAHDSAGVFIPFAQAIGLCLTSSLPILILLLTLLNFMLAVSSAGSQGASSNPAFGQGANATDTPVDFTKNDLLLGSRDPVFWFLVPLFAIISVGVCALMNYAILAVTYFIAVPYNYLTIRPAWLRVEDLGYVPILDD